MLQGRREGFVCRDRFRHVRQRSNREELKAPPVLRRGSAKHRRRGVVLIDLDAIELGKPMSLVACPPYRPPGQRLSGPDPDRDMSAIDLVEDQARHPGAQRGISVDRRHPDELHLRRPYEQRESQEIVDIAADVGIEEGGTSHV